jgi:hypothetical protein
VHDVVNDALGEVLQERVHVGDVAQVADVVGDEVAGVAVKDLDGVAWGFADGHDVYYLLLFLVLMCLLAKAIHGGDLPRLELGLLEQLAERHSLDFSGLVRS